MGRRMPLVRDRPTVPGGRGGAGSNSAASSRGRVIAVTPPRRHARYKDAIQEQRGRKAAVADQHEVAPGSPAACLQGELTADIEQRLVAATPLAAGALGRDQCGEEGQRPDPFSPWHGRQQHQAHPAQPAGLDEVAVGRAYGIAVDALGRDALAAAALDGVIQRQHHGTVRRKGGDQQAEQDAGAGARAPDGAAEDAMVVHEAALARAAGDPQQARHRAPPRRQDGTDQQHLCMAPGALAEQRREGQDDPGEAGGQRGHGGVSWRDTPPYPSRPLRHLTPPRRPLDWPKSSLYQRELRVPHGLSRGRGF